MKSITITAGDAGQRVDRYILKTFDKMPKSLMFKEIRKKNIKVNKKRCAPEQILNQGDVLELYLKDDVLHEKTKYYDFLKAGTKLDIIYEDENIVLINKEIGVLCHPDGKDYTDNLVARLKRYLYEKGEWSPDSSSFTPSLANRLDRNTGGIVIAAKNSASLKTLNAKLKSREIDKYYLAVVHGKMPQPGETLTAYLTKDERKNKVSVSEQEQPGSKKIITRYSVLDYYPDASLLEIKLLTGRTHQIRAHLAHVGHPLFGDGKYGENKGRYRQALYSYKLIFDFSDENNLSYLDKKEFQAKNIKLLTDYKERKFI